jgi:mannosyl-oligosaccharide alpha-1,2-mannosidase
MIDALDTLLLAEIDDEADAVVQWIDQKLSYDQDIKVSVFETTIRVLGGLISAYQKTGKAPLIRQAVDLGKRLAKAFETPSGVPDNYVNLRTGAHEGAAWNGGAAILSELGSLQMEFRALSDISGDKFFDNVAQRAIAAIKDHCGGGFCPRNFRGSLPAGSPVGLGSFGDSFYEYLLKYWIQTGKTNTMYESMWKKAADHIAATSSVYNGHFVPNGAETGSVMEHLACFSGGLFALSYHHTKNDAHLRMAKDIAETCHFMYQSMETKLAPDVARIGSNGVEVHDAKYILRPETVETYFYLWKVTHDTKYRDWGAEILAACNKHLRVDAGYVGSTDVRRVPTPHNDMMETFWFAETLKYLYLLFSEDELFDLNEWVFNTEAHAFRVTSPVAAA